jgi:predicted nucleic acid-binding protein
LAVVLLAKQRGVIPSAAKAVQALISVGFRLDEQLIRDTLLRTVGEAWPP